MVDSPSYPSLRTQYKLHQMTVRKRREKESCYGGLQDSQPELKAGGGQRLYAHGLSHASAQKCDANFCREQVFVKGLPAFPFETSEKKYNTEKIHYWEWREDSPDDLRRHKEPAPLGAVRQLIITTLSDVYAILPDAQEARSRHGRQDRQSAFR
eukprot:4984817-Prymnesium_polylepis.1